ncbi:MAG: sialidase family protein, partial [Bacteroidota bacterium]|nr:sialidase family protein [Bacteroidota bacterium]
MKNILITLLLLSSGLINAQSPISTSTQSTATERNNARLIAEDNNGGLHVTFYDNGIYYSFSDDNGTSWTNAILIDETGRNPSLAIDNNNILHIAYKLGGINAYDIVHRTYNDGTWSELDYIYCDEAFIAPVSRPVIAVDSENNLHCVFQKAGYTAVPNSEIWYNKFTIGTGWETPENISNSYGASEYPTLTIDNNDNIYAFWKDSGEDIGNDKMVLFRKYTVGTGWDTDYTNISNTTGNGSYATMDPSVVTDINGNIHLVWKDSEPGNREILYKKCTGGVWDTEYFNISNTDEASAHPSISTDCFGNLHVFWAEKIGGIYYEIAYKKYDSELETWSELTNISNTASVESEHPNTPANINNSVSVIWTEGDNSPFSVLYYGELLPVNINENNSGFLINIYPNPTTGIFTIKNLKASERPLNVEIT